MKALAQERHNAKMLEGNENHSIAKNLIFFNKMRHFPKQAQAYLWNSADSN